MHHVNLQTPSFSAGLEGWEGQCCTSGNLGLFPHQNFKGLTLCLHNWGCCSRKQSHLMVLGSTLGLRFYTIFFLLLIIWTWENTCVGVCNSPRSHSLNSSGCLRSPDQLSLTVRFHECSPMFKVLPESCIQAHLIDSLEAHTVYFQNHYDTQTNPLLQFCLLELTHQIHTLPQTL